MSLTCDILADFQMAENNTSVVLSETVLAPLHFAFSSQMKAIKKQAELHSCNKP